MDLYAGIISRNHISSTEFQAKVASNEHFRGSSVRSVDVGAKFSGSPSGLFHAAQLNRGINAPLNICLAAPFVQDNLTIVSHSRLNNRDELCSQLGIKNEVRSVLPDYVIILKSWIKWGAQCVHKLRGDWSFLIYDENSCATHIAVDFIASYQVFYAIEENQIMFSNHTKAVIQLKTESPILNEKFILNRLMIHPIEDPITCFSNVFAVAPGHLLSISKDLKINKNRYWYPHHLTRLDTTNDGVIVDEFLQIYETAVRRRILPEHKIGSHLSGGLDSGSVSWLASKVLKEQGRPLMGLTGTELFDTSNYNKGRGNEERYAQITAAATKHMTQYSFKCEGVSMIDSIRKEITRSMNLIHGVGNIFWIHAISTFAKECGLNTILVGQTGNATVTWSGKGVKSFIKKEIPDLINIVKMKMLIRNKSVYDLEDYPFTLFFKTTKKFLKPEFMKRHTLKELQLFEVDSIDSNRISWIHKQRMNLLNFYTGGIGSFWEMMSIDHGLYHWDPTADQDVVEFCMRLPESYYAKNKGRNLVRTAFDGKIPKEVLYKRLKGRQSSDWMIRFSYEIPQFNALIDAASLDHQIREFVDLERFRSLVLDWEKEYSATGSLGHPFLLGTIARVLGLYFILDEVRRIK